MSGVYAWWVPLSLSVALIGIGFMLGRMTLRNGRR